jgi:uncharacterized protein (DUF433 family)
MAGKIKARVVIDDRIRHGKPIIKGTRITVDEVLGALIGGMKYEEIESEYGIEREDILAVIEYNYLDIVTEILRGLKYSNRLFPATELYGEKWMLRILSSIYITQSQNYGKLGSNMPDILLPLDNEVRFFSEGQMETKFTEGNLGPGKTEGRTNADGIFGHINITDKTVTGIKLKDDATQFVVVEAKMGSKLSKGTKKAKDWDQASRIIACIARHMEITGRSPKSFRKIGFVILAPESNISKGYFDNDLNRERLKGTIKRRCVEYNNNNAILLDWFDNWVEPLMDVIRLELISWESAISIVSILDPNKYPILQQFYNLCKNYNNIQT